MSLLSGVRLLLVEDDEIDARAFQRMLAALNRSVHCDVCTSIEEALKAWYSASYDLIVADFQVREQTALELLPLVHQTPMIIVTGAGDEELAVRLLKAGVSDYVVKDIQGHYLRKLPHTMEQALKQQRLKTAAEKSRRFALALADIALAMSSTLDLDRVLERIMTNLSAVVPHDRALLLLVEGDTLVFQHGSGFNERLWAALNNYRIPHDAVEELHHILTTRQPVMRSWGSYSTREALIGLQESAAFLGVPLIIENEVTGILTVERLTPNAAFQEDDAERLTAFATHAALALHNAHLYRAAQELATLEERQRLARDLHDSVTQMLFSATTITDAAYRMWQRDPSSIQRELDDLRELTQSALAEMRTLLLELKPEGLQHTNLAALIRQLASTLANRAYLDITLQLSEDVTCPLPVKTALFRITQEAFNNIVKHAQAASVKVQLEQSKGALTLLIVDDGVGFDPNDTGLTSLGLRIMRERAAAANINLTIEAAPARGTSIQAVWWAARDPKSGGRHG
ncbi:MAG: histidine kinase [Aggregatilineales bacterium]